MIWLGMKVASFFFNKWLRSLFIHFFSLFSGRISCFGILQSQLIYLDVSWGRIQSPEYYMLLLVYTGCDDIDISSTIFGWTNEPDEKQTTQESISSSVEI